MVNQLENRTVLVIDDELNVLNTIRRVLREEPYRLLLANSAKEALSVLKTVQVDVLVTDHRMPEMTGIDLLTIVRRKYPAVKRIMLSGQSDLAVTIEAINTGEVFRYLPKPCRGGEISAAIRQALQLPLVSGDAQKIHERKQRTVISELEHDHPGISDVRRDADGAIVVEEDGCDIERG